MIDFWNQRYSETDFAYGEEPNVFFAKELSKLPAGALLLPAEGEGRNAVFAANSGWSVTAFDSSSAAKSKAETLGKENEVSFRYDVLDIRTAEFPANKFDAVGLIYVHLPPQDRKALHTKIADWLTPGGTVILEAFNTSQLDNESGGPQNSEMLYTPEILREDFADFDIVYNYECTTILAEGKYHQGKADVVRFLATKKS